MKITALLENTSACGLPVEHGLSLYIETNGLRILFDSGKSTLFAENADRLGVDLAGVDLMVLSHGHNDHGGGLEEFLKRNTAAKVYLNVHAFEQHYKDEMEYIGLDPALKENPRLVFIDRRTEIADGLTVVPASDVVCRIPVDVGNLSMDVGAGVEPEDFRHEQYLLVREEGKTVLFTGCSHIGILNLMEAFRPDVQVGGFHFMHWETGEQLKEAAEQLNAFDADYYTGHCTGMAQFEYMSRFMKRLHYLSAGDTVTI